MHLGVALRSLGGGAVGVVQAGGELAGLRTWSEREVRVADRGRSRLSLSVHLPSADKARKASWHVPDFVVAHPSASGGAPLLEAVELGLTFKSAARLRDILMAYAASPLFTRVTYYTWSRGITVAVEDAAASISLHARQLVRVRPFPGRDYGNVELTRGTADILDARALRWTPNA